MKMVSPMSTMIVTSSLERQPTIEKVALIPIRMVGPIRMQVGISKTVRMPLKQIQHNGETVISMVMVTTFLEISPTIVPTVEAIRPPTATVASTRMGIRTPMQILVG